MNSVQAQSDEMSGVSVTISDVGENFGDCIELAFRNSLVDNIYLAIWDVAGEGELTKNLFQVYSPEGGLYPYVGKMIKRPEPSKKQMLSISSGGSLTLKVELNQFYKITSSVGKVAYSAFVPIYTVVDGKVALKGMKQLDSNDLSST